ncbi:MAG: hypothetical protein AAGG44_21550, partial [Planctomycetota bacterium]
MKSRTINMTHSDPNETSSGTNPNLPHASRAEEGTAKLSGLQTHHPAGPDWQEADPSPHAARNGIRVGDLIGAGGMGQVFRAWEGNEEVA